MSKETVKKFFEELEKNLSLKEKFQKVLSANSESESTATMIDFAKASGFSFAEKDVVELCAEFKDNANGNNELNDDDLRTAAGGTREDIYRITRWEGHPCGMSIISGSCQ